MLAVMAQMIYSAYETETGYTIPNENDKLIVVAIYVGLCYRKRAKNLVLLAWHIKIASSAG